MSLRVRFKPAAELDVESAFAWYEERETSLGSEFLTELDRAISGVTLHPESFPVVRSRVRRAVLLRFPYLIFYVIDPGEIVVLACMHASRDPETWPR